MANFPTPDHLVLTSRPTLCAEIFSSPFSCALMQASRVVWRMCSIRMRDIHDLWHPLSAAQVVESRSERCRWSLRHPSAQLQADFFVERDGLRVEVSAQDATQVNGLAIEFDARADEHYLGLGERFDGIDQRGHEVDLHVVNGASGGKTYKPIPFFLSSAGYAVQILSSARCLVRLATPDDPAVVSIRSSAPRLSFRIFAGSSAQELVQHHASCVGLPPLPPAWVLGPWKSRDWTTENQQTVYEDLGKVRQHHLAGTVKLIDAAWESAYNSFDFDATRFPQPEEMIARARHRSISRSVAGNLAADLGSRHSPGWK